MDLSSYRREYSDYRAAVERERYEYEAGLSGQPRLEPIRQPRLEPIRERYSDLWSRGAIDDLSRKFDDTPAHFETERAGLRALASAARLEYAEERAAEVSAELVRCEASARVSRGGAGVPAANARRQLARETDAALRADLAARLHDSLRPCEDLRAARLDALGGAARSLGLPSLLALHEQASGADLDPSASFDSLASRADSFLARTDAAYSSQLARWRSRELGGAARPLAGADEPFFARAAWLDAFFAPRGERAAFAEVSQGLGLRAGGRRGVRIDDEERPAKSLRPACFGVRPPEEVLLVLGAEREGAAPYLDFFFEAGRAQHFAWSSQEMAARHPEFIHAPDDAVRAAAGFLFRGLFRDAAWAGEALGLRASDAEALARGVALLDLWDVRRSRAGLRWALALDAASDARSEQLSELYVSLHAEATGFRPDPAARLSEAEAAYGAAVRLRARLMAESLREHLRARYGRRWHASRAAGDELIDLWNSGLRYGAEELARLAWGGALDFDLLADALTAPLDGG